MKRKITSEDFHSPVIRQSSRLKTKSKINDHNKSKDLSQNPETKYVLQKLEDIKKREKVPLNIRKKLEELEELEEHVKLIHKVPPQHKIECIAAHGPTKEETKQSQKYDSKNDLSQNPETKHVLQKLEDIKKREKVPLNVKKKLQELHVKLIHKVPPQHKIECTAAAHGPTKEETKQFQKYGPLRKGAYSPEEDKIIKNNWNAFCELHDWDSKDVKPFLTWRHEENIKKRQTLKTSYYINIKERKRFVRFLANGLPWRTLFSVYRRFKTLYDDKLVNVRYKKDEDEVILMYIQNEHLDKRDNKYTELAKLLKRTTQSISKRYQYLKRTAENSKNPSVNVKWRRPVIKKKTYIKTLLYVTLSEDINDLKFAILPKLVWQEMEKKLNIDQNVLKTYWQHQLHMQLFSTRPIYLNDIKIQLIEYMYVKGISNAREIMWSKVASHFDGATPIFLCKVFYYLVQECRKDIGDKNFVDIVEHLYNTKINAIKNASHDYFLPRILYKDDKLVTLDEENSNATIADIDKYDSDTNDSDDENNS